MSGENSRSIELIDRPEPHFLEGRQWPHTGWLGRTLWIILVVMLIGATVVAWRTEMIVQVPMTGSVAGPEDSLHVTLLSQSHTASHVETGQPVRLRSENRSGWGIIVGVDRRLKNSDQQYIRAAVAVLGPEPLRQMVAGEACEGRVLVGFVSTMIGLWQLATNQPPYPTRSSLQELRRRIPAPLRASERYQRIEREILLD